MPILSNVRLVYWALDGGDDGIDVSIVDAKSYLESASLKRDRAEEIAESTAFRRAVAKVTGKVPGTERTLFPRFWTRKTDGMLTVKIMQQEQNESGKLDVSDYAEYELTEQSGVRQINGPNDQYVRLRASYNHATNHYNASDVTKIIQKVLVEDGLGAYPCKPNGGVYFVPLRPGAEDMLTKLTNFCRDCGTRFLTYDVPDIASQREEIAAAAFRSITSDLDIHATAIVAYGAETKKGILENRRTSLTATAELVTSLSSLLNGKATELQARITELRGMVDAKEKLINEAKKQRGPKRVIEIEDETPVPPPIVADAGPSATARSNSLFPRNA